MTCIDYYINWPKLNSVLVKQIYIKYSVCISNEFKCTIDDPLIIEWYILFNENWLNFIFCYEWIKVLGVLGIGNSHKIVLLPFLSFLEYWLIQDALLL